FTTPLSPPPHLLPYTTLFRSRAGSRATGGWPRRSRGGSRRSTRPIPCSTTSRSAINGCRATALTAAIRSSSHPAASSPSAATGKAGGRDRGIGRRRRRVPRRPRLRRVDAAPPDRGSEKPGARRTGVGEEGGRRPRASRKGRGGWPPAARGDRAQGRQRGSEPPAPGGHEADPVGAGDDG